MSWTSLDDLFTGRAVFQAMPYDVRWHFLCMIQVASRTCSDESTDDDGVMRRVDALRCSDVDDPEAAVSTIIAFGLVVELPDGRVRIVDCTEYLPPPHKRDRKRKKQQRTKTARWRAHQGGDHSQCLPEKCSHASVTSDVTGHVASDVMSADNDRERFADDAEERSARSRPALTGSSGAVTGHVTGHPGTGRDGTGQDRKYYPPQNERDDEREPEPDPWASRPCTAAVEPAPLEEWVPPPPDEWSSGHYIPGRPRGGRR